MARHNVTTELADWPDLRRQAVELRPPRRSSAPEHLLEAFLAWTRAMMQYPAVDGQHVLDQLPGSFPPLMRIIFMPEHELRRMLGQGDSELVRQHQDLAEQLLEAVQAAQERDDEARWLRQR